MRMLDNHTSFDLTTKQKNFLQYYAVTHKMTVAEVIRKAINDFSREVRLEEIRKMKEA